MRDFTGMVVVLIVIGMPLAGWITSLVFRHHERMEMLRRGIIPPPTFDKAAYKAWKRSGAPWPPPGAGPQQTAWTQQPAPPPPQWAPSPDDDPQRALYKGIRVALIGLAITIGIGWVFGFRGNPVVLGGLIPMFVGIAQIIVALLSGAQLPGVTSQTTFIPPPHPPPGPGAPPPPGAGFGTSGSPPPPWAQQPGRPRFEELTKPVPPPDIK